MSEGDFRQPWILDPETQFPLGLFPTMDAPNVYTRAGDLYHKDPDEHHIFHTKRGYSQPNAGMGGAVVRFSRIQTVRRAHHDAAHRMLSPPPIITQDLDQFDTSVWSLMNYLPRTAIDVRGDSPEVRELDDNEYELLRELTRSDFSRGFHSSIGKFFIQTMIHHHKEVIDEELRCQFFEAKHQKQQQRNIGNRILKLVASHAVEPMLPQFTELKKNGAIPADQKSPYRTVLGYARAASGPEKVIMAELSAA